MNVSSIYARRRQLLAERLSFVKFQVFRQFHFQIQKAHWIPEIEGEEDTSYFDTRVERYDHSSTLQSEGKQTEEEVGEAVFAAFNTCSPRYSLTGFSR